MENSHKWELYTNSESAWSAMLQAIACAKESIDIEQYILCNDVIGSQFIDLLIRKSAEGIKIRILCDTVGSFSLYNSDIQDKLHGKGIELKFFNSIVPWSPHKESLWFFRDHKKLMIVDKKVGFTGGICIAEQMKSWRDSHMKIEGEVVGDMMDSFEIMWQKQYHKPRFYLRKKKELNAKEFYYITNSPLPRKRFMYGALIRAMDKAKKYINLTTPYFLPDHKLVRAIKRACKRGVKVELLVPMTTSHFLVNIGANTFFDQMLSMGVRIFRYKSMIHSKTAIIDGVWSTIGSLNLDNLSLRYNFEGNIVSTNMNFASDLEKQFLDDLKFSNELSLNVWRRRPFFQKFLELLVWPLRKLL